MGNFGHILPYTDGFLGPLNLAILALFSNFALIRYLKCAFLHRFGNIWGGDILANRPKLSKIDPKKPSE